MVPLVQLHSNNTDNNKKKINKQVCLCCSTSAEQVTELQQSGEITVDSAFGQSRASTLYAVN